MAQTRIQALGSFIATKTTALDQHLASTGRSTPSFDPDPSFDPSIEDDSAELRKEIFGALHELTALIQGPLGIFNDHLTLRHWDIVALQSLYRFNLAVFPDGEDETTFLALAKASGQPEALIRRIVRYLMTMHIFRETVDGKVAHTGSSRLFSTDEVLPKCIEFVTEELYPCSLRALDAMQKWPGQEGMAQAGYQLAHSFPGICFDHMTRTPAHAARMMSTMKHFMRQPGYSFNILVEYITQLNLPKSATIVDIGGNTGDLARAIAAANPEMKVIVQDRAEVVAEAQTERYDSRQARSGGHDTLFAEESSVEFMAHDFFSDQTTQADVYIFRWIFHDWSDTICTKIIKALVPALKPGARILINEHVVPSPGQATKTSRWRERYLRSFDMAMLAQSNGKERESDDWIGLFAGADPRFEIQAVHESKDSEMAVIDFRWADRQEMIES